MTVPVYAYTCGECGETVEVFGTMERHKAWLLCRACRRRMPRDIGHEHRHRRAHAGNWPMASDAAGINPEDAARQMEVDRRLGVPTEYDSDGRAIFTSRQHRKRYCEAHGLFDRNGGYGDPQRR